MAGSIALVARKALTHNGRPVRPGTRFTATPLQAAALTHSGQAAFADRNPTATEAPAPPTESPVLPQTPTPDDTPPDEPDEPPASAPDGTDAPPAPKAARRRKYQRADLEPEA